MDQAQLKEAAEHETLVEGAAKKAQTDCEKSTSHSQSEINAAKAKLKADMATDMADEAELEQAKEGLASKQAEIDKDQVREQAEAKAEAKAKQAVEHQAQQITELQKVIEQEQEQNTGMKQNANQLISTAADETDRSEAAEHSAAEAEANVVGKELHPE